MLRYASFINWPIHSDFRYSSFFAVGVDPVTDGDDNIEAIKLDRTIRTSNVQNLHIAFLLQLLLFEYVTNVFGNDASFSLEKFSNLFLGQPNRLSLHPHFHLGLSVF